MDILEGKSLRNFWRVDFKCDDLCIVCWFRRPLRRSNIENENNQAALHNSYAQVQTNLVYRILDTSILRTCSEYVQGYRDATP